MRYYKQRKEAEEAQGEREEPEDWDPPNKLDLAWTVWVLLESTGWAHLPFQGGILEQPEAIMSDVSTIAWLASIIKDSVYNG